LVFMAAQSVNCDEACAAIRETHATDRQFLRRRLRRIAFAAGPDPKERNKYMAPKITQSKTAARLKKIFERKRTGPFHRDFRGLMNQLVSLRGQIRDTQSPEVRAFLEFASARMAKSHSQLFQDLFVEYTLNGKRNGYFCEFGATDGISLSNTFYLEKQLGWTGICAEPALGWHADLARNRPGSIIEKRCVWTESGKQLIFSEASERTLSSLTSFANSDGRGGKRAKGSSYSVTTVSLTALLTENSAPKDLDYISIDTEGSELAILSAFDFDRFRPKILTVEHNFMPVRDDILALMTAKGYRRVLTECSQWDDWYVANLD
jgi:FkbM family methyltransferase